MKRYEIIRTQGKTATDAVDQLASLVNKKLSGKGSWFAIGGHALNENGGKWFATQSVTREGV